MFLCSYISEGLLTSTTVNPCPNVACRIRSFFASPSSFACRRHRESGWLCNCEVYKQSVVQFSERTVRSHYLFIPVAFLVEQSNSMLSTILLTGMLCRRSSYMTMLSRLTSRCVLPLYAYYVIFVDQTRDQRLQRFGRQSLLQYIVPAIRSDRLPIFSDYHGGCRNFSSWSIDISSLRCSCSSHHPILPNLN